MGKAVTAQMHAAIPAGDDNDLIGQPLTFQHLQDHGPGPRLTVIGLEGTTPRQDHSPAVMRGLGKAATAAKGGKEGLNLGPRPDRPDCGGVTGPPVAEDIIKDDHPGILARHQSRAKGA